MTITRRACAAASLVLAASCARESPTIPIDRAPAVGDALAANKQADPASGSLRLCKQAGAGLAAGQLFTFRVTLAGVVRTAQVAAGACVPLEVPRESAPLSKGSYRNTAGAIARLLPAGATLTVGDAPLSSAQLQALLDGGANVSTSSALLLNLAQQLIAAELNVLRGVQPSAAVLQAIVDANAALHVTTAGSGVQISTALATPQLAALVEALSDFNGGTTKTPAPPASAVLQLVESAAAGTNVTAIACDPALRCANADLAGRSVSATVASGATTTVTYTNTAQTILRVCKVTGPGIAAGTVFHVGAVLLANTSGSAGFDVPAGDCRDAVVAPGSYAVQETLPAGVAAADIACAPAERCGTPKLVDAFVIASVVDASTTTVTYTNRSTLGTLRVCKAAGAGIAPGAVFHFSAVRLGLGADQAGLDVPAGECRDALVREGPYALNETKSTGIAVTAIDCAPAAACESPKLADGFVIPTVTATSTTIVTYTNRSTLGTLRVCTNASPGFPAGTGFSFGVSGLAPGAPSTNVVVRNGECGEVSLPEGPYLVTEDRAGGIVVSAILCEPDVRCSTATPAAGLIAVSVAAQATTTVTYVNSATAPLLLGPAVRGSP